LKVKKREEIESIKILKKEEKKNKKRTEITKKRLKIDPAYVEEKSENSIQEVNKISTSIREVNCALDKLLEKYNFKIEVKEDIKKEMLDTAKIMVKKVEKINEHLSYVGKGGNSDINYFPTQNDSKNDDVEIILGV
tara:strand:- start:548 stop:955 length:408 start_codon:yes stop_codon:yes gene_type:complete